jgi:ABC-type arginine/histidine transport system permease subunit
MSNAMDAVVLVAVFVLIAAAIYLCLTFILKRLDARHERQSTNFRRKHHG